MGMLAILGYWAIDAFSVVWSFILSGMNHEWPEATKAAFVRTLKGRP